MKHKQTFLIILIFIFLYGVYWHAVVTLPVRTAQPDTAGAAVAASDAPKPSLPQSSPAQSETQKTMYIVNKNTKKFHRPSWSAVAQMNEKNKKSLDCTYDEAVRLGYTPCKICFP